MSLPLSRTMSAATAAYGAYALARPRHLGRAMTTNTLEQQRYDVWARAYGVRDLTVSALGLLGRSERVVTTAMAVRIASDVVDGAILSVRAHDGATRAKVLGVTLGWAALNTAALVADRR
jgi:hypothetical protein